MYCENFCNLKNSTMNQNNDCVNSLPNTPRKLRFGTFEVDLELRELRNRGVRLRLQQKPFQVLELLLKNPGALVRREELMKQLWPDLHVNFDSGLNTAVNTLRQVLGDSLRNCRFIETRPGLGYRFLMPVEAILHAEPSIGNGKRFGRGRTASFEAQQDYLKATYFFNKLSEDDLRRSIAYFESSIKQDPSFAAAYAGLANAYSVCALLGTMSSDDAHRRAKQLIATALQIDDALPEAHVSLAGIKMLFDRDWSGAEKECLRAIQTNPSYASGHQAYAALLALTERLEEALRQIRQAQELDPLSVVISMEMAWILYLTRDFQGAIEQAWKALVLEPKFAAAQYTLGLAYEQKGMTEEAVAEFKNACSCSGHHPAAIAALGHAYSLDGRREEASQTLNEIEEMSRRRSVSPYWKSIVQVGLGSSDLAFQALNECCERRDIWLILLRVDPRFDPIRGDARFGSLSGQLPYQTTG
jgi:DNA-binding winged helix-turn-helix (wHTH) protein/Flp pilus assembly protein TadD